MISDGHKGCFLWARLQVAEMSKTGRDQTWMLDWHLDKGNSWPKYLYLKLCFCGQREVMNGSNQNSAGMVAG
jgi:hypothetical protein